MGGEVRRHTAFNNKAAKHEAMKHVAESAALSLVAAQAIVARQADMNASLNRLVKIVERYLQGRGSNGTVA